MTGFFAGVQYFFAGFGLITKPGIKRYVIIPLLINIVMFTLLFMVLRHYMTELNAWATGYLPAWLQWLGYLLWLLFFIGFFLIFVYAFAALGTIAAAPFNGLLAAKIETYLTGEVPANSTWAENLQDIPRIFWRQLCIIGYYLPRAVVILLLCLVPIVHGLALVLWFFFSAWYLTLQYMDFPTDNHRIPLSTVRDSLYVHQATTLGFGVSLMLVMSIPILNFFAIPAAVAGATQYYLAIRKIDVGGVVQ